MPDEYRAAPPMECPHCNVEDQGFIVYGATKRKLTIKCGNCFQLFDVEVWGTADHLNMNTLGKTPAKDPTCGSCFKPLSKHYHEREIFCTATTTGDIYTTEPRDDYILDLMSERHPELYQAIVNEWKKENGHEVTS